MCNRIELVRIEGGTETILEVCKVPDSLIPSMVLYPPDHIEEAEKYYARVRKPRITHLDVIYVARPQKERW